MAAKGNGLALGVAAIGVAAVADIEIDQSEVPRRNGHATKLQCGGALDGRELRCGFEYRLGRALGWWVFDRQRFGAHLEKPPQIRPLLRRPLRGPWRLSRRLARRRSLPRKPHAPGAADRGIAGVGSAE